MAIKGTGLNSKEVRSEFFNRFEMSQAGLLYPKLTTRIQSEKDAESYKWLGTVPQMRPWGTGRKAVGLRSESYNVANEKYEATIEVDRDEIDDDQTGQIRIRINELAQRAAQHKDYLLGQLFINGATAGFNSYDGVTFFNAAHVSGASGNQSNTLTFNASDHTNVTTDEFKKAFNAALAAMLNFKDDQGLPMGVNQGGLVAVVPPALQMVAREAMNATIINNTSNVFSGAAMVETFPFLTSAVDWFLCKNDGVVRPFVFQDRSPMEVNDLAEGSEEEFRREKYLYGVRARYALTYGYWQFCVKTTFN